MTTAKTPQRWSNPLVEQRADPHLSLHEGRYWFTASVPAYDGIELRCADSLDGLRSAPAKLVWRKHDSGPMSWHVWAPELHRIDGVWTLYVAASQRASIWQLRMYVLQCEGSDPLKDPNRHTRVQPFGWNDAGFPEFGVPLPDGRCEVLPLPAG